MTERQEIHAALEQIAERELRQVNLMPAIRSQLQGKSYRPSAHAFSWGWALALALILLLGAATAAVAAWQGWLDPGLEHARQQNLLNNFDASPTVIITPAPATPVPSLRAIANPGQTDSPTAPSPTPTRRVLAAQTIKDTTVTLNWAYADANRIAVRFTVSGVKLPEGVVSHTALNQVILADAQGQSLTQGGEMGLEGPGAEPGTWVETKSFIQTVHPLAESQLDVVMTVRLGGITIPLIHKDRTPVPGPLSNDSLVDVPPIGDFVFRFTIPVYPAVTVSKAQTAQQGPITMTLKSLSVAPSFTYAVVCYNLPDQGDWAPEGALTVGNGAAIPASGWGLTGATKGEMANQTARCVSIDFPAPYSANTDTSFLPLSRSTHVVLRLDSLHTSARYDLASMQKGQSELLKEGIEVEFVCPGAYKCGTEGGYNIDFKRLPAGMTREQAYQRFQRYLWREVEGPWTFQMDLP